MPTHLARSSSVIWYQPSVMKARVSVLCSDCPDAASPVMSSGIDRSATMLPPGTSRLPHMQIMASTHWPACMPLVFWSKARPQAMDAGWALAYMRATV